MNKDQPTTEEMFVQGNMTYFIGFCPHKLIIQYLISSTMRVRA